MSKFKITTIIGIYLILFYFLISSIIPDKITIIGSIGSDFAIINYNLFGYFSYFNMMFLIFFIYKITNTVNKYETFISYSLLSFSFLILYSIIENNNNIILLADNFTFKFNYLFGEYASIIFVLLTIPLSISILFFDKIKFLNKKKKLSIIELLEQEQQNFTNTEEKKVKKNTNIKFIKNKIKLPNINLLEKNNLKKIKTDEEEIDFNIMNLLSKLRHFNIDGDIVNTYVGPIVSTFEFKPNANVKVSKISGLQDDLAMSLKAETIRIQAPIPGKDVVGIEIPNKNIETIYLRDIFESKDFLNSSKLTITLGKDITGKPYFVDIRKLPHLLIAGTTGSGKSVGLNAIILSLLYKNTSRELKLLMIDPKMLEFSVYNDIPHLITPVITKSKKAIKALSNMVLEMENRYELMTSNQTKNIETYNEKVKEEDKLPYIVIIIDELADLMMTSGKEVEHSISRLAQMARASGIHLIVATQRPSVDVITGLIKANLPSRISFRVGQKIDSKIILDQMGAESLLGKGDMLFTPPGMNGVIRLHAPWSSEKEIEMIVDFLKSQETVKFDNQFFNSKNEEEIQTSNNFNLKLKDKDELFEDAKIIIQNDKKTSISYLQRKLRIGYNRSASIIESLEVEGFLSKPNSKGQREIV